MVKLKIFSKSFQENLLVGRIAKDVITSMFEESGYYVYPFGHESVFAGLKKELHKRNLKGFETAERIRSMPDLLVGDEEKPSLVEVKFNSFENYTVIIGKEQLEWYKKYWPDSFLIYVTQGYCNFYCQKVSEIRKEQLSLNNFRRLDKIFPRITLDILIKYKPYVMSLAKISSRRRAETHQPHNFMPFVFKFLKDNSNKLDFNRLHEKLCSKVLLSKDELKEAIKKENYGSYILLERERVCLTEEGIEVAEKIAKRWNDIGNRWTQNGLTYSIVDRLL